MNRLGPEQIASIPNIDPHIPNPVLFNLGQKRGHSIQIGLAADQSDVWIAFGLPNEVFTTAEADFQPKRLVGPECLRNIYRTIARRQRHLREKLGE